MRLRGAKGWRSRRGLTPPLMIMMDVVAGVGGGAGEYVDGEGAEREVVGGLSSMCNEEKVAAWLGKIPLHNLLGLKDEASSAAVIERIGEEITTPSSFTGIKELGKLVPLETELLNYWQFAAFNSQQSNFFRKWPLHPQLWDVSEMVCACGGNPEFLALSSEQSYRLRRWPSEPACAEEPGLVYPHISPRWWATLKADLAGCSAEWRSLFSALAIARNNNVFVIHVHRHKDGRVVTRCVKLRVTHPRGVTARIVVFASATKFTFDVEQDNSPYFQAHKLTALLYKVTTELSNGEAHALAFKPFKPTLTSAEFSDFGSSNYIRYHRHSLAGMHK